MSQSKKRTVTFVILPLICILVAVISMFLGRYQLKWKDFSDLILSGLGGHKEVAVAVRTVVLNIRLPRVLAAMLVGGTLSLTGAAYQGMFRNPMVSPSILGVSSAASFGAALAILLSLSAFWIQTVSFLCGVGAIVVVYLISLTVGQKHDKYLTLILAGMVVSAIFTAMISLMKYLADPYDTLPSIVYWLMGGLSNVELSDIEYIAPLVIVGSVLLTLSGWKLDMLSFGDHEARSLGINVGHLRLLIIVFATLMTAAAICISGMVGWVGLLVPHITRMLIGPGNTHLLPASFFTGATFLIVVDDFSRTISSMEIPLGITTALIGAPFFIFILLKTSHK